MKGSEYDKFDIMDADRILFSQNREKSHVWETADPAHIATIASLFSEMVYGEPVPGGVPERF